MNTVLTIVASILIFGLIVLVHELGHFLVAKACGVTVLEFSIGMGPKLVSWGKKTVYSLRLLPIGGFVRMEGEDEESEKQGSFSEASVFHRVLIILAGAFMNLVLGFVVIAITISTASGLIVSNTIAQFTENAVTEQSGLRVGDTLYSVNGRRVLVADDVVYEMIRVPDDLTADIVVIRDGEKVLLKDVQFEAVTYSDGSTGIRYDFYMFGKQKTFANVISQTGLEFASKARLVYVSIADLITGRTSTKQLSGPVGIIGGISQAVSYGLTTILELLSLITINLGIFNLLPIPALDGGKLVFLIIEGISSRKPSPKVEGIVTVVGFALLIGLMIYATTNDISRLLS